MRQMKIDRIWGPENGVDSGERTEAKAAAWEMLGLVEELVAALKGERGSGEYVVLKRESAAARFLVRAKVATFHPRDARRLRLVDFGRELDD